MRTIRASEIGSYVYCNRAWWYQIKGHVPDNRAAMISGQNMHSEHSRRVLATGCLRTFAYIMLLLSIVILTAYLTLSFI